MENSSNKPIYIVGGVFLVIFIMIIGINVFFLDNKENMTSLPETEMGFTNTVIELDGMYLDKNSNLVELNLKKIDYFITSEEFTISLKDQDNKELKTDIIKGSTDEVDADIYQTDYKIRFKLPKETWYIKAEISRDNISYDFTIDYRDFVQIIIK